ncbi:protein FAM185A isoform X1 [Hylobates moloch]|uniref:protein FAM185A isoform X1 n=2 Tax=Hylobates moloch TaxID=81572 RepID=UPI0013F234ED|nr:protein FAM185A isoform X1 [Hylobates moloch]
MLAPCSGWELGCFRLCLRQVQLWAGAGRWACQARPYSSGGGERWPGSETEVPPPGPARRTLKEWTLQVSPFGRLRARLPCHLAVKPLDPLTYPDGDRVLVAVCGVEGGARGLDSLQVKYDENLEEMAIVSDTIHPQASVEVNAPLKFGLDIKSSGSGCVKVQSIECDNCKIETEHGTSILQSVKMPKGKEAKGKKLAPVPAFVKNQEAKKAVNTLFEKRPKNFGIGQDIQPKRDLTCFVKWPRYIRLQWQRAILCKQLKVSPVINQFTQALDGQTATPLLKLAHKYRPETKQEKKQRLLAQAEKKAADKGDLPIKRPPVFRAGVNTVTTLVDNKKAQLVVIAHDMDPIELTVFLPVLCHKMGATCCIIKGKARLGRLVHRKTYTTVDFTQVNSEDKGALAKLVEAIGTNYKDRYDETHRHWGGNVLGPKSVAHIAKLKKAEAKRTCH